MANSQVPVGADPKYQDIITSLDDDKTGINRTFIIRALAQPKSKTSFLIITIFSPNLKEC